MAFRLFVDSSNGVTVEPEWNYKERDKKIESRHRTRTGAEYVYKWGGYQAVKFKVSYVDSSFKAIVNSYWNSNADLLWMEEGSSVVSSVHVVGKSNPINAFNKPYNDTFKGVIELATY